MATNDEQASAQAEPKPDTDLLARNRNTEPGLIAMLARDGAVILGAFTLWGAGVMWADASGLAIAKIAALSNALLTAFLLSTILHEWGHYAGARLSGAATKRMAARGLSAFRFNYDADSNGTRSFHWLSVGGAVGHWGAVLLVLLLIPIGTPPGALLLSGVFAFAIFATVVETPVILRVLRGMPPGDSLGQLTRASLWRDGLIGGAVGTMLYAALA